jgi:hypothetical protein
VVKNRALERSDSDVARELQAKLNNMHHWQERTKENVTQRIVII